MDELFPPFAPDPNELRPRRFKPVPFRMIAPNMITLMALCLGLTAIRLTIEGRIELALAAIVFAAVLDGIDGRVARLIKGQSRFGAELDSLADFVNFGVVPGLILYFWKLNELANVGWIAVMLANPAQQQTILALAMYQLGELLAVLAPVGWWLAARRLAPQPVPWWIAGVVVTAPWPLLVGVLA